MDATQQAQLIQSRYNTYLESIRSDGGLSPEGKVSRIAAEYERAGNDLKAVREANENAKAARRFDLQRQLFGLEGGTDPQSAISYRDAQDRVANLKPRDQEAALNMLHRAQLSGDTTLVKALAQRAVEAGWQEVLQAYADSTPGAEAAINELASLSSDSSSRGLTQKMAQQFIFNAAKPAELR